MKETLKVTQNDLFLYLDSKIPRRAIQMNLADTPWRLKGKLCDVEPMDDQWDLFFHGPDLEHQAWLGLPKQPSVPQETLDAYARRFEEVRHLGYIHRR